MGEIFSYRYSFVYEKTIPADRGENQVRLGWNTVGSRKKTKAFDLFFIIRWLINESNIAFWGFPLYL